MHPWEKDSEMLESNGLIKLIRALVLAVIVAHAAAAEDCQSEGPNISAETSMLQLTAEEEAEEAEGEDFDFEETEHVNETLPADLANMLPAGTNHSMLQVSRLGRRVIPRDTHCVVFSDTGYWGYYSNTNNGGWCWESNCPNKYDDCMGCKYSAWKDWTGCNSDFCVSVVAAQAHFGQDGRKPGSFRCGSNAKITLCKSWSTTEGRRRRYYMRYDHSDCFTSDWGQDKKNGLGGGYIYYSVTTRNQNRRRRSRRRRTFLGIR